MVVRNEVSGFSEAPKRVVLRQALQVALLDVDEILYGGRAYVHHGC